MGRSATPRPCAVVCEDAAQVAKIVAVRERLPQPAHDRRHRPAAGRHGRRRRSRSTRSASAARERDPAELDARARRRHARGPVHVHLHVGHDRAAEGLRAHARQLPRDRSTWSSERRRRSSGDEVIYLFLPLAHAFALLIQLARVRPRRDDRLLRRRHRSRSSPELQEVKPTYLPVGAAHLREDLHARARASSADARGRRCRGAPPARRARCATCRSAARRSRPSCRRPSTQADEQLFANVRAIFGGRAARRPSRGAAPIAQGDPRVLLRPAACRCSRATA